MILANQVARFLLPEFYMETVQIEFYPLANALYKKDYVGLIIFWVKTNCEAFPCEYNFIVNTVPTVSLY